MLFLLLPWLGRAEPLPRGEIVDPVTCSAGAAHRYVLYVPSSYTPERRYPVIFCFDAAARGRLPVERLQAAAERYGYIVAGSLTSRNGPLQENAAAADAMMNDVVRRLAVDRTRVYLAGFSGGARVATALALAGVGRGVIACGAGFPARAEGVPARVPFAFFGTVGHEDFNHGEFVRLGDDLAARGAVARIMFFAGGHDWASAEVLTEAVAWLELQGMRTGVRERDAQFIAAQWQARLQHTGTRAGLERWRELRSLVADFDGLTDVTAQREAVRTLGRSAEVRGALKAEEALLAREERLTTRIAETAYSSSARRREALVAELKPQAEAVIDTPERRMVRRAIASYVALSVESLGEYFDRGEYRRVAAMLETAAALRPGHVRVLFDLARARALNRDEPGALQALRDAVAAGYRNLERLENEPAFNHLRTRPEFQEIRQQVAALRK